MPHQYFWCRIWNIKHDGAKIRAAYLHKLALLCELCLLAVSDLSRSWVIGCKNASHGVFRIIASLLAYFVIVNVVSTMLIALISSVWFVYCWCRVQAAVWERRELSRWKKQSILFVTVLIKAAFKRDLLMNILVCLCTHSCIARLRLNLLHVKFGSFCCLFAHNMGNAAWCWLVFLCEYVEESYF